MGHEFIIFKVAGKNFALPIEVVKETAQMKLIYPVPNIKQVSGLVNINGTIVLLIDLCFLLKLRRSDARKGKIIVFKYKDDLLGFLVENLQEVINIEEKSIIDTDHLDAYFSSFSSGVFEIKDELVVILNLDKIFSNLF